MHGTVALSAFTVHKPPVRNRELVTDQIIARNAPSRFRRGSPLYPVDSLPASSHHSGASSSDILSRCSSGSSQRHDDLEGPAQRLTVSEMARDLIWGWERQIYELAALDQIQMYEMKHNLAKVRPAPSRGPVAVMSRPAAPPNIRVPGLHKLLTLLCRVLDKPHPLQAALVSGKTGLLLVE
jgi:hypothetical protein